MANKAIFLDRDGTIIEDKGYLDNTREMSLLPGVAKALADLKKAGFLLIVITNQSGIGRGLFSHRIVDQQHQYLQGLLATQNLKIDAFKVCPHAPEEGCNCRKPMPGLLCEAAKECDIDLPSSFMIGDKTSDVQAGKAAGCQTILLTTAETHENDADVIMPDLAAASEFVLNTVDVEMKR